MVEAGPCWTCGVMCRWCHTGCRCSRCGPTPAHRLVLPSAQVVHVGGVCQMHTPASANSCSGAGPLHRWVTFQGRSLEICKLGVVANDARRCAANAAIWHLIITAGWADALAPR